MSEPTIINPTEPKFGICDYKHIVTNEKCDKPADIEIIQIQKEKKFNIIERKCIQHFNLTRKDHDKRE